MDILSPFASTTSSLFRNYNPDLTLTVSDGLKTKTFRVHRIVLMSNSHYFRALLSESFQESGQNEIDINETNPDTFSKILDLMYGQNIKFEDWIDKLDTLVLVQFFQIEGINIDESLCYLDLEPKDIPKYFIYIQHFYPQTLPLHLSQCIGGMIKTTANLQLVPMEYRSQLVPESDDIVDIVRNRTKQRSAISSNKSIRYCRFVEQDIIDTQEEHHLLDKVFPCRNFHNLLLNVDRYMIIKGYPDYIFNKSEIENISQIITGQSTINKYDIDNIDKIIAEIIENITNRDLSIDTLPIV